jgi:ubiquinone/menaquinone biosynthesis C-methylase UbiE
MQMKFGIAPHERLYGMLKVVSKLEAASRVTRITFIDSLTTKTAERYNQTAGAYRDLWAPVLRVAGQRLLRELAAAPAPPLQRIVDIGTGVGALMPDILATFPQASLVGIDRSPGMLALALRGDHRIVCAVADARELPLASASVDLVLMVFMLFHLPDPADGLREARRVLRPGGRVATVTWGSDFDSNAGRAFIACLDEHGAAAPNPAGQARHEPLNTDGKMQELLRAAGFSSARGWEEQLAYRFEIDHLLELRTHVGSERARFESLSTEAREACLTSGRRRMQAMSVDDFVATGKVVYAVAS